MKIFKILTWILPLTYETKTEFAWWYKIWIHLMTQNSNSLDDTRLEFTWGFRIQIHLIENSNSLDDTKIQIHLMIQNLKSLHFTVVNKQFVRKTPLISLWPNVLISQDLKFVGSTSSASYGRKEHILHNFLRLIENMIVPKIISN